MNTPLDVYQLDNISFILFALCGIYYANCCMFVWNLLVRIRVKSCTILFRPILFLHLLISLKVFCFWTFKTFILFVNYILFIIERVLLVMYN